MFLSGNKFSARFEFDKNDLPSIREEKKIPFSKRGNTIYYLSSFEETIKSRNILTKQGCSVLSISNNNGGVRKTTSTANIGSSLAFYGYRVLLIDMDPQCHLTRLFKVKTKSIIESIIDGEELEITNIQNDIYRFGRLDVVASDLKKELEFGYDYKKLESVIEKHKKDYDFIIFDTPPQVRDITHQCLKVSDYIFIPLLPDEFSIIGAIKLLDILDNYNIKLLGGLITSSHKHYSTNIAAITTLQKVFTDAGSALCPIYISYADIFNEIAIRRDKNSILEFEPNHKCTAEYLEVSNFLIHNIIEGL